MTEIIRLIIGVLCLVLGFPLGKLLAHQTKEELQSHQSLFKTIILGSLIGGLIGLIIKNDVILFSFFFIAIVTSQSLKKR